MENYCVAVPCKTYIRKYFTSQFGNPIPLKDNNSFQDTILTKLWGKPLTRLSNHDLNIELKSYNDEIRFRIPFDFFYRLQRDVSIQQIVTINRFLQNTFEADMFIIVNIAAAFGLERKLAIEAFSRKYNIIIDEDISLDAMLKKEYRSRTKKTFSNHFLVALSGKVQSHFRA